MEMNESSSFDGSTGDDPAGSTAAALAPVERQPSRLVLAAAVAVAVVSASVAAGAVIGHETWPGAPSKVAAPTSPITPNIPGVANPNSPYYAYGPGGYYSQSPSGSTGGSGGGSASSSDVTALAAKVDPALVDINSAFSYQGGEGAGTGIVLTSSGEVITNNHVIDGATSISVTDVGNGKTYSAKVVGYDSSQDIAVLQLQDASGLQTASIGDSSKVAVGDSIVALGNAGGTGGTPSSAGGTVTGLNQSITASDEVGGTTEQLAGLIQIDADIQPGDSGGSLVNSNGQVIGIDTAASAGFSFTPTANQADAIPINQAISIAKQIESGQGSSLVHIGATAMLGVLVEPSSSQGDYYGNGGYGSSGGSSSLGATISSVINGDPAQQAGLGAGDVITSIDGQTVDSPSTLTAVLADHQPGDKLQIGWTDTSGQAHSGTVDLAAGPPA